MAVQESPMQAVKRLYGNKDKLVDAVVDTLKDAEQEAGELKERLLRSSNKKLLRLAEVGKTVKDKYGGSKDKLVAALAEAKGKAKDADYVARLQQFSPARLLDMLNAATTRQSK